MWLPENIIPECLSMNNNYFGHCAETANSTVDFEANSADFAHCVFSMRDAIFKATHRRNISVSSETVKAFVLQVGKHPCTNYDTHKSEKQT